MRICKLIFFNPSFNTLTDFNLQSKDAMEHILNKKKQVNSLNIIIDMFSYKHTLKKDIKIVKTSYKRTTIQKDKTSLLENLTETSVRENTLSL